MYSHSSTSSLQPASNVAKSVSKTNMSGSGSDPGDLSSSHNSVTVTEARKRSYLVGSVGPTSLLGTAELEKQFPDRTIWIFVGTCNMNGQVPPRHLAEFLLPANLKYVPDLLVVGTQETFPEKTEWEVRLTIPLLIKISYPIQNIPQLIKISHNYSKYSVNLGNLKL